MDEELKAKKPKGLKLPKSLGACADLLKETSIRRLAEQKKVDAIKAEEDFIKNYLIEKLAVGADKGAEGLIAHVSVYTEEVSTVTDWDDFRKYITRTKAWDMLSKSISQPAIRERLEAGKKIPGLGRIIVKKLSVKQAGKK